MLLLAAATTTARPLEKIQQVPTAFWVKLGLAILVVIALGIVLRKVAHMNKVVLGVIVFIVATTIGFNWVYERNEPAWATPVVEKLAGFFPTKGGYARTQAK